MKAFVELEYELVDDTCAPKQIIEDYKTNFNHCHNNFNLM